MNKRQTEPRPAPQPLHYERPAHLIRRDLGDRNERLRDQADFALRGRSGRPPGYVNRP